MKFNFKAFVLVQLVSVDKQFETEYMFHIVSRWNSRQSSHHQTFNTNITFQRNICTHQALNHYAVLHATLLHMIECTGNKTKIICHLERIFEWIIIENDDIMR